MISVDKKNTLFWVIADIGKGSKIFKASKELGATGGTFFYGKGTVESHLLDILGINEIRKEILIMAIEEELEEVFHRELTKKFHLDKPNHGIAFSTPISSLLGVRDSKKLYQDSMPYEAIFTIVDKGLSSKVLESAQSVGSAGGTIIHARGSGAHEQVKLFNINIDPEKEIVLILSVAEKAEAVVKSISEGLDIENAGAGVLFVLGISKTSGIFKKY